MIHKNQNYGNRDDVTLIEFGHGTLRMFNGLDSTDKVTKYIFLTTNEPVKLGFIKDKEEIESYMTDGLYDTDKINPEVILAFTNKKSINNLINQLRDLIKTNKP